MELDVLKSALGTVRVAEKDGEPMFVGKDVCEALGLKNHNQQLGRLEDFERGVTNCDLRSSNGLIQSRKLVVVNESGLYSLIFRSRKKEAKAFKRWVTTEVLPSLRKSGSYGVPFTVRTTIYGREFFRYDWWLLQNGYSTSSGSVRERIRKHPGEFVKQDGAWWISRELTEALLWYKEQKGRKLDIASIMADVVKIEDTDLRVSITNKIIGGTE
ncbi:MAG: BRO family protein [Carboxylicivirga sp.]|jgi:hypothetical protein|nr:BRO family protein [Carboxylicivirga sp.]